MRKPRYYLNPQGEFVIENYNLSKPFANFFPGIAGKYGIPMWVFYVNRAQAITSFGIQDKDHSMAEFFPANKAWQLTSLQGFRTFIKLFKGKTPVFYEPFHNGFSNLGFNLANKMSVTSYDLKIEEENLSLGLDIKVEYFNIPQEHYAALARLVTIKNTSGAPCKIQLLDGLPQIVPYGVSNLFLKKLGRTIEAWMGVENLEKKVPFYKLDVDPVDRPQVIHVHEGNFFLGFHYQNNKPEILRPIVDSGCVFGPATDFSCPRQFLLEQNFRFPRKEITHSKTPCAFLLLNLNLKKGGEKKFCSLVGFMRSKEALNSTVPRIIKPGYLAKKEEENKRIIQGLQSDIHTQSSTKEFDLYAKQTYLDNIIRGGYPITFKTERQDTVFYLYSRKHGDLERDYNKFQIQPTYFSQGNGNYRDANQNRRSDTWFNPDVKDKNIITFLSLIQTDGFNPLVVKGINFSLENPENFKSLLKDLINTKTEEVISFLSKPFSPGELLVYLEENKIRLKVSPEEFLNTVLTHSLSNPSAEHGEGFWTDHWTYNLDLLEGYLGIYPEKKKEIIFEKNDFTFYDNTAIVKPRSRKYILYTDNLVKQLHSVTVDPAKKEMIKSRTVHPHLVRTEYGRGEIYQTTLINKLFCILVNKLASFDPFGVGIEMEADKPNWYDALNGLPALFGSSSCETFELKRMVLFIKNALEETGVKKIFLSEEIREFLLALAGLIEENLHNGNDYEYWDKSYALKEEYRQKSKMGLSGRESEISTDILNAIFNNALAKINQGLQKARDKKKDIYYTYFINEVVEYKKLTDNYVLPTKFKQINLPLFLESQMHALRLSEDTATAKALHKATKTSNLYDKKLKMYKVADSLESMPYEIGRCRAFTPGWLENESIWLHMEYKYLLELLKQGLTEEFYEDFKNVLIPFLKPHEYGRSILENSSFLVSSVFPDKDLHGNGFVARLSGSTAEFIQMWLIMNVEKKPFVLNEKGELNLKFSPSLAGWLFDKKGSYSFNFLSKIKITYHNPKKKNTFGKNSAITQRIVFKDREGKDVEIFKDTIPAPYAQQIRLRQINQIDVYLG